MPLWTPRFPDPVARRCLRYPPPQWREAGRSQTLHKAVGSFQIFGILAVILDKAPHIFQNLVMAVDHAQDVAFANAKIPPRRRCRSPISRLRLRRRPDLSPSPPSSCADILPSPVSSCVGCRNPETRFLSSWPARCCRPSRSGRSRSPRNSCRSDSSCHRRSPTAYRGPPRLSADPPCESLAGRCAGHRSV